MNVTLEKWAEMHLNPKPSANTLRTWAREGRFDPPAVKHGRQYYVDENARYRDPAPLPRGGSLLSRIERARNVSKAA